jgi:hypothetical protein
MGLKRLALARISIRYRLENTSLCSGGKSFYGRRVSVRTTPTVPQRLPDERRRDAQSAKAGLERRR